MGFLPQLEPVQLAGTLSLPAACCVMLLHQCACCDATSCGENMYMLNAAPHASISLRKQVRLPVKTVMLWAQDRQAAAQPDCQ